MSKPMMNETAVAEMFHKGVEHVVKAMEGKDGEQWEGEHPMYQGVLGWNGPMSPMNRPAFVKQFGEENTKMIEAAARKVLADRSAFWQNSKAKGYEAQADALMTADPATYKEGDFVWGVMDGCKCDHEDLRKVVKHIIDDEAEGQANVRLCRIIRIEEVENIEANMKTLMRDWKPQENEGGSNSDDVTEEEVGKMWEKYSQLTDEQKRTFYTLAVLIRDRKGKFVLIDPEGYSYPRYAILPKNWRTMYAGTAAEIEAEIKAAKEAAEAAAKQAEEDHKRKYAEECAEARRRFSYIPCPKKDDTWLRTGDVSRNLRAILKREFPGVKFTVHSDTYSMGDSVHVRWVDGPDRDAVQGIVDIFGEHGGKMTDGYEFTTTAATELCGSFSYAFTGREITPATRKAVEDLIRANLHGADDDCIYREANIALSQTSFPNGEYEIEGIEFADGHYKVKVAAKNRPRPTPPTDGKGDSPVSVITGGGEPDNGIAESGEAFWKENKAKHGIEIYFPAKPSDYIIDELKYSRFRYSRFSQCWYNRMDEGTFEKARDIVMQYNKEVAA